MKNKIVLTFGVFDILHTGHINLLREAKKLGDILVVGIPTDYQVKVQPKKLLKSAVPSEDRLNVVEALDMVDFAFVYANDEALEMAIKLIKPDVYARGGDWADFPSKDTLDRLKIPIVYIPYYDGISSTAIKERIMKWTS